MHCIALVDRHLYPMLLYADETLLLARTCLEMNKLLALVIDHSALYGLRLNFDKCKLIIISKLLHPGQVKFPNGSVARRVHELVYLGALFTDESRTITIVKRAIASTMTTAKRLQLFWKHGRISVGWKLVVPTAVIRSQLCYTLESVPLLGSHLSLIDSFYYKCLRKILNVPATFVDRYWTNARRLAEARHR
eukprot:6467958-Amphidinium_carterae.5